MDGSATKQVVRVDGENAAYGGMNEAQKLRLQYAVEVLTVAALCAFFFFYGLGNFGLVGADEPRYAQVAREMLDRDDFVTPTLHGDPWLEKPALYYWRATAAFRSFGVQDWVARLPSATFALPLVVIIYFHMRRFRPGAQLDAALITASAAAIIGFSRGASTDMQLAAPFAIAMLGWYAWYETGSKFWLFDLYFFLAVGTLAKGPIAPGLAAIIIVIFAGVRRDWRLAPGVARESTELGDSFAEFLVIWAVLPVIFFSLSQSKLPGYVLPAIPPCTILVADYLQKRRGHQVRNRLLAAHTIIVGALTAAFLLLPHLVLESRQAPPARALWLAIGVGIIVAAVIFFIVRLQGHEALRIAT